MQIVEQIARRSSARNCVFLFHSSSRDKKYSFIHSWLSCVEKRLRGLKLCLKRICRLQTDPTQRTHTMVGRFRRALYSHKEDVSLISTVDERMSRNVWHRTDYCTLHPHRRSKRLRADITEIMRFSVQFGRNIEHAISDSLIF